jgi:DNA-directed RNA polymerase subunit RPC12/RpoP
MVKLELKICEGCGATYTRRSGEASPYCARCQQRFAARPSPEPQAACPRCLSGIDSKPEEDCAVCSDLTDQQAGHVRAAIQARVPQPVVPIK